mmetsp:Transcript_18177/g.28443  ORF Transcript_18177/g.28443 Transcript_18177/m.28443 type:complete len:209 (+) Transcript_18177:2633-3259(+)
MPTFTVCNFRTARPLLILPVPMRRAPMRPAKRKHSKGCCAAWPGGCSADALATIRPRQRFGIGAREIAHQGPKVADAASDPALAAILLRIGHSHRIHGQQFSVQRTGQGYVFHQRLIGVAADTGIMVAADQQALIAVRQSKQAGPQVGPPRDKAATAIKAQFEIARFALPKMTRGHGGPSRFKHRVRMQHQQPLAPRSGTSALQLPPA